MGELGCKPERHRVPGDDGELAAVRVPVEPPELNRPAARVLLAILVELTKVEVLDRPREGWVSDER